MSTDSHGSEFIRTTNPKILCKLPRISSVCSWERTHPASCVQDVRHMSDALARWKLEGCAPRDDLRALSVSAVRLFGCGKGCTVFICGFIHTLAAPLRHEIRGQFFSVANDAYTFTYDSFSCVCRRKQTAAVRSGGGFAGRPVLRAGRPPANGIL